MADVHPCDLDSDMLLKQCDMTTGRRSGPGGQHRNKVESAIVLTHQATGVTGQASERRSQHENRKIALQRLRINLALAIRTARGEEGYQPSSRWNSRLLNGRISINANHEDFAACLAEVLDVIQTCEMDTKRAAEILGCTHSQLIKFLGMDPSALVYVNRQRQQLGLRKLT